MDGPSFEGMADSTFRSGKRAKWKPDTLDLWTYHVLAFPLAELKNAPDLAEKIGAERLRQYEKVIMDNLQGSKEAFRKRLEQEKGI